MFSNGKSDFFNQFMQGWWQGSTLRKNFISPAGLVSETFTSPEIFLLALILMTTLLKQ